MTNHEINQESKTSPLAPKEVPLWVYPAKENNIEPINLYRLWLILWNFKRVIIGFMVLGTVLASSYVLYIYIPFLLREPPPESPPSLTLQSGMPLQEAQPLLPTTYTTTLKIIPLFQKDKMIQVLLSRFGEIDLIKEFKSYDFWKYLLETTEISKIKEFSELLPIINHENQTKRRQMIVSLLEKSVKVEKEDHKTEDQAYNQVKEAVASLDEETFNYMETVFFQSQTALFPLNISTVGAQILVITKPYPSLEHALNIVHSFDNALKGYFRQLFDIMRQKYEVEISQSLKESEISFRTKLEKSTQLLSQHGVFNVFDSRALLTVSPMTLTEKVFQQTLIGKNNELSKKIKPFNANDLPNLYFDLVQQNSEFERFKNNYLNEIKNHGEFLNEFKNPISKDRLFETHLDIAIQEPLATKSLNLTPPITLPQAVKTIVKGLIVAIVLGCGLAFFLEFMQSEKKKWLQNQKNAS
ncbi:MAG: hypothetical protein HQM11_16070 [SAR324 cluster bacterium]|nr:hypothetical protein [SAR324 cluster bacterium]